VQGRVTVHFFHAHIAKPRTFKQANRGLIGWPHKGVDGCNRSVFEEFVGGKKKQPAAIAPSGNFALAAWDPLFHVPSFPHVEVRSVFIIFQEAVKLQCRNALQYLFFVSRCEFFAQYRQVGFIIAMTNVGQQHLVNKMEKLFPTNIFTKRDIHFMKTGIHQFFYLSQSI